MPRQKLRTSRVLEKAVLRTAGLKAIDPNIDFGDACNIQNLTQQIERLRNKIIDYNTTLAVIDTTRNEIEEMEKNLGALSERILLGVAWKYGKDSSEYEMAGGVRKSDRIRKSTATRLKAVTEVTADDNAQSA
ncbi:hypothetical protein [Calothrix sp. PCC 7507]|uniref:hypothetical protein n=1 Tax=Calothrix sp. PCC 7507 TaxID=99598 RepID=UPI00029F0745|nr:hypothetical protein [Calothrix sp. PCC 7507]AFY34003.1 hypothetical protein Cal7507_3611 [Calothrix sp. PCC 7507]